MMGSASSPARGRRRRVALFVASLALLAGGAAVPAARASDCGRTSTGLIPLSDLGAGTYQGYPGGLYPGGVNVRPAAHEAAGVALAQSIVPLDTLGQPSAATGRITFINIGMSNNFQEFGAFIPKAMADPTFNGRVKLINCAQGGQTADLIVDPNAAYWSYVNQQLRANGSAPAQVQVIWLKDVIRAPTGGFPAATLQLSGYLGTILHHLKVKFPNVRQIYLASRIYAGYADIVLNPEPYAYESGFAVQWLIGAQIAGEDSLNFDPNAGPVRTAWLSWGPYLWADGTTPRSDGLTWHCAEFSPLDGTHPSASGEAHVADSLLAFFKRDTASRPWFVGGVSAAPEEPPPPALAVAPNPARQAAWITLSSRVPAGATLEVFDVSGRRVRRLASGGQRQVRWDLDDEAGRRVRAGLYWIRPAEGSAGMARRLVVLDAN